MTRKIMIAAAALAAAGGLTLTACSVGSDAGAGVARAPGSTASSSTPATAGPSITPLPTPTNTAGSKRIDLGGTRLPLEIYSLHREGTLVTLRFGLRNTTEDQVLTGGNTLHGSPFSRTGENDVSGVYLVDPKNKKKYEPARLGKNCLCTNNLDDVGAGPGQTIFLTATYAAPPDDITSVDVHIPKFGTITGVPVS